jgi:hypothetical protein
MGRYSVGKSLSSSEKVIDTTQAGQHLFPAQGHDDIKHRRPGQLTGEHGPHPVDQDPGLDRQFIGQFPRDPFGFLGAELGERRKPLGQLG